jgi:hypothetical protein
VEKLKKWVSVGPQLSNLDSVEVPALFKEFIMKICSYGVLSLMKRRRLYYVPGLISIIGLPLLLFFYWPKEIVAPTFLKVFLPTDRKDDPGMLIFSKEMVYKSLKDK